MSTFLFFSIKSNYYKYMVDAVLAENNTKVFQPVTARVLQTLYRLHFAWPLNKHKELPLHWLWYKRLLKGMRVGLEENVFIIMNENCCLSYSKNFLNHLKKVYPSCKICFVFSNPVDDYIKPKLARVNSLYDSKITFFEDDAKKYGITFTEICPFKMPFLEKKDETKSDVFFVGRDKGRLGFLIKIYENLTSRGFVCDFNIIGVSEESMMYKNSIHYNRWMPYDEVLQHVNSTKCVLELLQNDDNYVSIKTYEALQYHKKLITTNSTVARRAFYNPDIIRIIKDPLEDISDFILKEVEETSFSDGAKYTSFKQLELEIESFFAMKR